MHLVLPYIYKKKKRKFRKFFRIYKIYKFVTYFLFFLFFQIKSNEEKKSKSLNIKTRVKCNATKKYNFHSEDVLFYDCKNNEAKTKQKNKCIFYKCLKSLLKKTLSGKNKSAIYVEVSLYSIKKKIIKVFNCILYF